MEIKKIECTTCKSLHPETLYPGDDQVCVYCRADEAERLVSPQIEEPIEEKTVELFALNIMKAGESFFENPMETPFIPTWNRVLSAIPDFLDRLKLSVELDNAEIQK